MVRTTSLILILICFVFVVSPAQSPSKDASMPEPPLPVIDYNACPFEGCTFRKWIVTRDSEIFSTWKLPRKLVASLRTGEVVTGLTGVHITNSPDRVEVLSAIPELGVQPGDVILRYMYHGEGFADIWAKGTWHREYDCTFIAEKSEGGCLRDCAAKVISEGRKDWWVRLRTSRASIGWTKVEDQFNCMDSLGGDFKCDNL
jgi:hypothetical protein